MATEALYFDGAGSRALATFAEELLCASVNRRGGDVDACGDLANVGERDPPFAALCIPVAAPVQPGLESERFLGDTAFPSTLAP